MIQSRFARAYMLVLSFFVFNSFYIHCSNSTVSVAAPTVISKKPLEWNWSTIDVHQVQFPASFGWGAASSAYQIEGNQTANGKKIKSSWTESAHLPKAGNAAGHWDRFREDVQLIKQAGLKEYRFSIKWSAVEPEFGKFDQDAMQHYVDLVDELNASGITPFVMLFHHEWPQWFGDLGDFQKKENIVHFTKFAHYVFGKLNRKVKMWMTFNEPSGYCLEAYYLGKYPPFKKSLKTCGKALKNMMDAHVAIYRRFKEINPQCQVGFAQAIVPLDPYPSKNPFKKLVSSVVSSAFGHMQNNVAMDYLRTGKFEWGFRLYGRVTGKNVHAKGAIDFIGVNYYSNVMLDGSARKSVPGRPTSDNGKGVYPEGLMRSIKLCAQCLPGVPMWIGENGICDASDLKRADYFKKHLWVVWYARALGYDIRGYHVWTLMDSFNWNSGFANKYGMYKVDFDTYERTLRDGAKCLVSLAKNGRY